MPLTKRQKAILTFIESYLQKNGYSPALDEIAQEFGISSLNAVYKHLKVLEERGFIRRLANRARSIQVIEAPAPGRVKLPLLGKIAAGSPIDAISTPEQIEVPEGLTSSGNNYVLQVEGDSMIEEHIQDGDLIIVEHREHAENGQTVVALIDGEQATLKKLYREGSHIRLQPANRLLNPIFVDADRLRVQGVVVGLMRRY